MWIFNMFTVLESTEIRGENFIDDLSRYEMLQERTLMKTMELFYHQIL